MEEMDYWRLCEEFNIVQAALLVVGEDPTCAEYVEGWEVDKRPKGYEAAKTAICGALRNLIKYENEHEDLERQAREMHLDHRISHDLLMEKSDNLEALLQRSIEGVLVPQYECDINGNEIGFIENTVDVYKSTVNVASLKNWLRLKGFASGFFFPELAETMDYLDPLNPRYAPKLAAAVRAWETVTSAGKTSPKKALEKWLREHAAEFGLTNDDGQPIENAIEECSKVANWKPGGGATKTPT